ncbi:MAG: tRNA lysidine(34) synthetase TilS [Acidobacteriota bacterium]
MDLLTRVRRFIRRHGLADGDTRVVVALSGGSDSVALAHIVRTLDAAGELRAVGLAHFNHQLRGAADADEQFCAGLAVSFGWPLCVDREDVAARARCEHRSIEDAAHQARHRFFERARVRLGANVVALGHTRDDQAETFLLRLLRGAGPRGLASMHPRRGSVVRPLLSSRRRELRAFLAERQASYVEDASNADVSIPRNRVRAELLPLLEERFNPAIVDVLADQAELARETWLWMEAEAGELGCTSATPPASDAHGPDPPGETARLDVGMLLGAPPALRRFAVWRAMSAAAAGRPIAFRHVEAAIELLESGGAGAIDAPGHRVDLRGGDFVLTSRPAGARGRVPRKIANFFAYPLSIPGEVSLPGTGWVLSAELSPPGPIDLRAFPPDHTVALVRRDLCSGALRVRNRRPGDRFRPIGVGGRKTLQDFFVDRKVSRQRRESVPLVVDESDRIVWVAGYGIDEAFRIADPAQGVLILRLKLLGGSA